MLRQQPLTGSAQVSRPQQRGCIASRTRAPACVSARPITLPPPRDEVTERARAARRLAHPLSSRIPVIAAAAQLGALGQASGADAVAPRAALPAARRAS